MGRKVFFEQVGMLAVLATFVTADAATANRNPKAEEVARTMMQAMGGQRAWDSLILFGSISRLPGTEKRWWSGLTNGPAAIGLR